MDIFSGAFNKVTLLEWVTVALFLGLVFVLSVKVKPDFLKLAENANK